MTFDNQRLTPVKQICHTLLPADGNTINHHRLYALMESFTCLFTVIIEGEFGEGLIYHIIFTFFSHILPLIFHILFTFRAFVNGRGCPYLAHYKARNTSRA